MKILVTGGSGNVGKGVVAHLSRSGHDVRVIDWHTGSDRIPNADYRECDITNFTALREQVRDMEGIVHLAAFPYPGAASSTEMFRVNCSGTYNVFEAAAAEGIRKVACASSINALGFNFGIKPFPIEYFPVDEEHPSFTTDPYSFSKETVEAIARYYWRRDEITSTCIRMPFVYTWSDEFAQMAEGFLAHYQQILSDFLALPVIEQSAKLAEFVTGLNLQRSGRVWEKPYEPGEDQEGSMDLGDILGMGYTDFWAIVSVDDTAQAFEKSLLTEFEGTHPLYINESENSSGQESEAMLRAFFPEVIARKKPILGKSAILSYDRAQKLIGYEPQYSIHHRGKG